MQAELYGQALKLRMLHKTPVAPSLCHLSYTLLCLLGSTSLLACSPELSPCRHCDHWRMLNCAPHTGALNLRNDKSISPERADGTGLSG